MRFVSCELGRVHLCVPPRCVLSSTDLFLPLVPSDRQSMCSYRCFVSFLHEVRASDAGQVVASGQSVRGEPVGLDRMIRVALLIGRATSP